MARINTLPDTLPSPPPCRGLPTGPRKSPSFSYLPQSKTALPQAPQMQQHATVPPGGEGMSGFGFARKARLRLDSLP
jgi:hypothetical protein